MNSYTRSFEPIRRTNKLSVYSRLDTPFCGLGRIPISGVTWDLATATVVTPQVNRFDLGSEEDE